MSLLSYFFPGYALKRMQSQLTLKMLQDEQRKFEGAARSKRLGNWGLSNTSVNSEIGAALNDLRNRSRELCRNNPYANGAPKRIANNVSGTGMLLTPTHTGKKKSEEKKFKEVWNRWADSTDCDFNGLTHFYGIQNLVVKSMVKNGEAFVKRVKTRYKEGSVPLELQVIDPSQIDTNKSQSNLPNGGFILNGIEFEGDKRVAYHIYDRNPLDFHQAASKRIPAEDICHIFDLEDPGQVRGVPFFASVILRMNDFDQFEDAQLTKQKVAAAYALFRKRPILNGVPAGAEEDGAGNVIDRIVPGMIEDLAPGEEIQVAQPPAVEGFAEFSKQSLQGQAMGLGMDYASFTGDLSNVNFSSGKMGWIQSGLNYDHLQYNVMIPMFLNKVFEWFMTAATLARLISDTKFRATWTPPRRTMIDPGKEIKAIVEQVRAGLMSWREAAKQLGYIPEELMVELLDDQKQFLSGKLVPTSNPLFDTARQPKKDENQPKQNV